MKSQRKLKIKWICRIVVNQIFLCARFFLYFHFPFDAKNGILVDFCVLDCGYVVSFCHRIVVVGGEYSRMTLWISSRCEKFESRLNRHFSLWFRRYHRCSIFHECHGCTAFSSNCSNGGSVSVSGWERARVCKFPFSSIRANRIKNSINLHVVRTVVLCIALP